MNTIPKIWFKIIFTAFSTFFIFATIKLAVLIPVIFSQEAALRFDFNKQIENTDERQMALLFSRNGLSSPDLLFILSFFIIGAFLYFPRYSLEESQKKFWEEYKKSWNRLLSIGATLLGSLVTIFSVWKN